MLSATMVQGQFLVKAKKLPSLDDEFAFEFMLTEEQKSQLIAELLLEQHKKGMLTIVQQSPSDKLSENERKMMFLKNIIDTYKPIPEDIRQQFLLQILQLSQEK